MLLLLLLFVAAAPLMSNSHTFGLFKQVSDTQLSCLAQIRCTLSALFVIGWAKVFADGRGGGNDSVPAGVEAVGWPTYRY